MGSLSRSNYGEKKQQPIVTLSSFIDNFRLLHKIVDAYKYVINESLPGIVLARDEKKQVARWRLEPLIYLELRFRMLLFLHNTPSALCNHPPQHCRRMALRRMLYGISFRRKLEGPEMRVDNSSSKKPDTSLMTVFHPRKFLSPLSFSILFPSSMVISFLRNKMMPINEGNDFYR
ncbi:hypothetical protein TNIN_86591 [Trichonephila inaurata madagascariensis]|uniref:Uncharacterized protein n=1 Tax=Trichonephila inaurata madagascariensis TaxID=2747483 RepID=A0A8X6Y4W5_9ARAC|nr:hypothetical protein TNIN_86591 [Trichonephila inaurata madagascariensis]